MPHPVKLTSWYKHRGMLLLRPKCAIQIGAIAAEWTAVENGLSFLFGSAFGVSALMNDGSGCKTLEHNWVALTTMQELETIRMRLRMVEKALVPLLPSDLCSRWAALEKILRARAKERSKAIQSDWYLSDERPDDLICLERDGRTILYVEKDFSGILSRITEAAQSTYQFAEDVMDAQRNGRLKPRG